jgi:uncharacterized MAPEG superfamily protein
MKPGNYVDPDPRPVPAWGKRANQAHLNAVETFVPFAALLVVVHLTAKANAMTALWAAVYFWMRLAHTVVYLLAIPYVRIVVFSVGYVAALGVFRELFY